MNRNEKMHIKLLAGLVERYKVRIKDLQKEKNFLESIKDEYPTKELISSVIEDIEQLEYSLKYLEEVHDEVLFDYSGARFRVGDEIYVDIDRLGVDKDLFKDKSSCQLAIIFKIDLAEDKRDVLYGVHDIVYDVTIDDIFLV